MPLSTEIFVMAIFIAGTPFFYFILRNSDLAGRHFFMLTYILLTLSNIFTVVEEFFLNFLFNTLEHLFITFAACAMLLAITKLTSKTKQTSLSKSLKGQRE